MTATPAPALEVEHLSVHYGSRRSRTARAAVDDVSFTVGAGETVGLVGESGSGKTTTVRTILGLQRASAGSIQLAGEDITHASPSQRRIVALRLRAVFQDPYSSLSPFQTIGETLVEPLRGRRLDRSQSRRLAADALESVGLPADVLDRYPVSFSGGQRQRIGLARALVCDPTVIILDEPVSALDLSTQAHVLNLLADLRDRNDYAMLFVSHDLAVVRFLCQRVVVLHGGVIVESGAAEQVIRDPEHPYTRSLVEAAPVPNPAEQARRREARRAAAVSA